MKKLRVILCNQLNHNISSLTDIDRKNDAILMVEAKEEFTHVQHHQKKIVFLISAMRHFALELKEKGYRLLYVNLDDPSNTGSISEEINRFYRLYQPDSVIITWPGEYRILQALNALHQNFNIPLEIREDNHFLTSKVEFKKWAEDRKELRMEYFYRYMRRKYNILMKNDEPLGGKWNYDSENRKFLKKEEKIPTPYQNKPDEITKKTMHLVAHNFSHHFGEIEPFYLSVTRQEALAALNKFIRERLRNFGDYQDAMLEGQPWMYHSQISFYLNCGLLEPLECIKLAEAAYHNGLACLNSVEGFIRQILGWREYVRAVYWLKMPDYKNLNFLNAKSLLPEFYWTAETNMNCLKQSITETKNNAYAHHIQRLMVIGNFSLLAGIDPQYVNEWYLIVYADAFEWVELPNVTGMILFADGGILGSKPYAASGAYIKKMSNYCQNCYYNVDIKEGPTACPFNYLYWDFLIRNRNKLEKNPRLKMIYHTLDKMPEKRTRKIVVDSKEFLGTLKLYSKDTS